MAVQSGTEGASEVVNGPDKLFATIAKDLVSKGYSINQNALPPELTTKLLQRAQALTAQQLVRAGVGRTQGPSLDSNVRGDSTYWLGTDSEAERQWLAWAQALQAFLNRRLFLGLFSFESHLAHYPEGAFYRRHIDAFKGESNRVLSVVAYLNTNWQPADGGELVIYPAGDNTSKISVPPLAGTLVVFLSEEFEHEVLPAGRDRFSIAGWYRVNSSSTGRADPPS